MNPEPIKCAHCGHEYTHQFAVVVYSRTKEDGPASAGVVLNTTGPGALPAFTLPDNPSRRRQGVAVLVSCEACHGVSHMAISQHKGQTFVEVAP